MKCLLVLGEASNFEDSRNMSMSDKYMGGKQVSGHITTKCMARPKNMRFSRLWDYIRAIVLITMTNNDHMKFR